MNKIKKMEGKLLLFLVVAIGVLCVGFIIISCGSSSSRKVFDYQQGQCAIDFVAYQDPGKLLKADAQNAEFPSIAGKQLTVEAWIKPTPTGTPKNGGIFGRYDAKGVFLRVETSSSKPVFGIRIMTFPTTTDTPPYNEAHPHVEYKLTGATTLNADEWAHVAGVLAYEDHTGVPGHGTCSGAESQLPHLDIYVNGQFDGCATVYGGLWGDPLDNPDTHDEVTDPQHVEDPFISIYGEDADLAGIGYNPNGGEQFEGVIDEVRLWTVARTADNINACMDRELGPIGSGECARQDSLKGYWRFNGCEEEKALDWSGAGSTAYFYVDGHEWKDSWVAGAPITPAD